MYVVWTTEPSPTIPSPASGGVQVTKIMTSLSVQAGLVNKQCAIISRKDICTWISQKNSTLYLFSKIFSRRISLPITLLRSYVQRADICALGVDTCVLYIIWVVKTLDCFATQPCNDCENYESSAEIAV